MDKRIFSSIGGTPIVHLPSISKSTFANIFLKMESLNPWGSVKDRVAANIIGTAEKNGSLKPGMHVLEATSGNTGISLAAICAAKGYPITVVMPEFVSTERMVILKMLGANIVLTPSNQGLIGPVAKSFEILKSDGKYFIADQTRNPANPDAHFETGDEIWEQMSGLVDAFVSASGTGGHITGIGKSLKGRNSSIKVFAVEPSESSVLSGKTKIGQGKGDHGITGIGPGFVPDTLDRTIIDEVIVVDSDRCYEMTKRVIREEGILIGVSTGAVLEAAACIAEDPRMNGKNIVAVSASGTERYLSTKLADSARDSISQLKPQPASKEFMDTLIDKGCSNAK